MKRCTPLSTQPTSVASSLLVRRAHLPAKLVRLSTQDLKRQETQNKDARAQAARGKRERTAAVRVRRCLLS